MHILKHRMNSNYWHPEQILSRGEGDRNLFLWVLDLLWAVVAISCSFWLTLSSHRRPDWNQCSHTKGRQMFSVFYNEFSEASAEAAGKCMAFRAGSKHHFFSEVSGWVFACSSFLLGVIVWHLVLGFVGSPHTSFSPCSCFWSEY